MSQKKTFTYCTEDGDEAEIELPVKMRVCPECEGHGTVLGPGLRNAAFTREAFEDLFHDEEDRQAYMTRGGKYDVECHECRGRNVVPVVDETRLTQPQKLIYEQLQKQWADEARMRAEDARTQRMESGDYCD